MPKPKLLNLRDFRYRHNQKAASDRVHVLEYKIRQISAGVTGRLATRRETDEVLEETGRTVRTIGLSSGLGEERTWPKDGPEIGICQH